jgi:hypothetical protein
MVAALLTEVAPATVLVVVVGLVIQEVMVLPALVVTAEMEQLQAFLVYLLLTLVAVAEEQIL